MALEPRVPLRAGRDRLPRGFDPLTGILGERGLERRRETGGLCLMPRESFFYETDTIIVASP